MYVIPVVTICIFIVIKLCINQKIMFTCAASVQGMMSFPVMPCDDNHGRLELGVRKGRNFSQISSDLMRGLAR